MSRVPDSWGWGGPALPPPECEVWCYLSGLPSRPSSQTFVKQLMSVCTLRLMCSLLLTLCQIGKVTIKVLNCGSLSVSAVTHGYQHVT